MLKRINATILTLAILLTLLVPTLALAATAAPSDKPAPVGRTVRYDRTEKDFPEDTTRLDITLAKVYRGKTAADMAKNASADNEVPAKGQEVIIFEFTIKPVVIPTYETFYIGSNSSFNLYSEDGEREFHPDIEGLENSDDLVPLKVGESITMQIPFIIAEGTNPNVAFDEQTPFTVWFTPKGAAAPVAPTAPTVQQPKGSTTIKGNVYVFSGSLNLRAKPDTTGAVLKVLKYGNPLTVVDSTTSNVWWAVKTSDGTLGYVARSYLGRSVFDAAVNDKINVLSTKINIREAANGSAKVLSVLPKNTVLTVLDNTTSKAWVKVSTADGITGWVGAVYVGATVK